MNHAPIAVNATYCATLCDQLWSDGLRAAFVAPGSRSTPLALALVAHGAISVEIFHDERAASFAGLGHGLATGQPALVLCSSGTAGAHFYAAVIEADASAIPLIVCTADRPPELWGRGAPQTIDQTHLYGSAVRDFVEPGPPDDLEPSQWRPIARRLWLAATGARPGPVHANLSFRDPLTGTPDVLSATLEPFEAADPSDPDPDLVTQVGALLSTSRGAIVAGQGETDPGKVLALAERLGWPILTDHRSGCRDPQTRLAIRHFDSLLRDRDFAAVHRPDVVLRIGEIVSSKALSLWLAASAAEGTRVVASRPHGRNIDPESIATVQFDEAGFVERLLTELGAAPAAQETAEGKWSDSWIHADRLAATAIDETLATADQPNEITIAQAALTAVPVDGALMVSSSMPVRDVEWFGQHRNDIHVYANRGANGIDGIIATATGIALAGSPTICLVGDVAFLHDSSSLIALRNRPIDLTIVVIDNNGGAIFSFLPQHELLDTSDYERLFGTPHGSDLAALATAHGLVVDHFDGHIEPPAGVRVVVARTERDANLALHEQAHQAVADAIAPTFN